MLVYFICMHQLMCEQSKYKLMILPLQSPSEIRTVLWHVWLCYEASWPPIEQCPVSVSQWTTTRSPYNVTPDL